MQLCRSYEVSIIQLRELKDVQHKHSTHTDQFVDAIKTIRTRCSYCGRTHTGHEVCPARGTFCKKCGKQNHWAEVCRSRQQPQRMSTTHPPTTKQQPRNVHSVIESPSPPCDDPKELFFSHVTVSTVTRDEALTHISVQLPTPPLNNTACMRVRVDTGAQGNVLPLRVFSGMFPEYMDNNIPKVSVLEQYNNTKLTAYNGTSIPHYGTITLKCREKDRPWTNHVFYVANSPGSVIIGLPSSQSLGLVTLHCSVALNKGDETNTDEPLNKHPMPERAWQILGTDLFNWNNNDYFIIVDYYSKFSYIRKLSTATSAMVAEQTKQILSECGIPQRVISDNGIQFTGEAYQLFVSTWGIEHVTKSAGYPMSNEILERAIRTVKNTLDKARKTGIDPYLAMLSIRDTPISDKIPSPAKLLLGRKLQINMPSYATPPPPDNRDITMQQLTQRKHSQEFYLDRHARTRHPLSPGDPITVKNSITSKWDRAFVVSRSDKPRSYIIQTEGDGRYRRNRRHLRPRSFEARNTPTTPDPMAIQDREPMVGETCTKVGRLSKLPVRYTDWT